jgi:hypothetical protein
MNSTNFANFALTGAPQLANLGNPASAEFLTDWTTCTNEMAKKTTCKKYYQKEPLLGGGTSGQATCGTCRLGQSRYPAGVGIGGMAHFG